MTMPSSEEQVAAAYYLEKAEETAHEGHNGHGCDDRTGYAGIALTYALVAVAYELRSLRAVMLDIVERLIEIKGKAP